MPPPLQVDLRPTDLESGVRVTCDVGYLCADFSVGLSVLDLGPMYVTDRRQTCIIAECPLPYGRGIISGKVYMIITIVQVSTYRLAQRA